MGYLLQEGGAEFCGHMIEADSRAVALALVGCRRCFIAGMVLGDTLLAR